MDKEREILRSVIRCSLVLVSLWFLLSGCYSGTHYSVYVSERGSCEVEVKEEGAGGNCTTKDAAPVSFVLWSVTSHNYSIMAQGLNSRNPSASTICGLLVHGVEQDPGDEEWLRLLRDPKLLCSAACGPGDWSLAEQR
jgi:hypothetical protein